MKRNRNSPRQKNQVNELIAFIKEQQEQIGENGNNKNSTFNVDCRQKFDFVHAQLLKTTRQASCFNLFLLNLFLRRIVLSI